MTNPFIYRKLSALFLLFIAFGNVYSKNKEMEQLFSRLDSVLTNSEKYVLEKEDKIEELEILFEKREKILQEEKNNKNFKDLMINIGIIDLDKTIKNLLNQNMIKIKLEIQKQKLSTITNNTYINNNQQKINIFNAKV